VAGRRKFSNFVQSGHGVFLRSRHFSKPWRSDIVTLQTQCFDGEDGRFKEQGRQMPRAVWQVEGG
jgi:hypothetical protein